MSRTGSQSAFSLIELLVVIAIIAVLAAIIFPVYSSARKRAQQTVCGSNLGQISKALFMYVMDQDDGGRPNLSGLAGPDWEDAILPYVGTPAVLECPSADDSLADPLSGRRISYGFHTTLAQALGGTPPPGYDIHTWGPARTMLMADARVSCISHMRADMLLVAYANAPDAGFAAQGAKPRKSWQRHNGGSNVCFLDGHVKVYNEGQLMGYAPVAGE